MAKKRVAIYIRVSTLDQAREGYSLEAQEKILRKWCKDNHCEIFDLYADRGISGKDIQHRPEMARLLRDAKEKKFDIALFWALNRFTRSVPDLYDTMSKFQEYGIGMVSHTEEINTTSSMGRAMTGIIGVFSQLEREVISERVEVALLIRAEQGKRTCSQILGYDPKGKDDLEINPHEAQQVKFYFEHYLIYKSLSEVAKIARSKDYRGKRGRLPTPQSIRTALTHPVYCGYNTFKGFIFKGNHEAIVSVEIYNKVQSLLRKQGKKSGRPIKKPIISIKP